MEIKDTAQRIWKVYSKNIVTLVLASLVSLALSALTLGILAGPLAAGMLVLCLKLLRGEPGTVKDVFSRFDKFAPTFILTLVFAVALLLVSFISAVPVVGWVVVLAAVPIATFLYILALGFITQEDMKLFPAARKAVDCFLGNPLPLFLAALVASVVGTLGFVVFYVPGLFTYPLAFLALSLFSLDFIGKEVARVEIPVAALPFGRHFVKAAVGALIAFFVVGLIFTVVGGRGGIAGGLLSMATGQRVSVSARGDSISVGGVTVGGNIPRDFPKDVPIYPKSVVQGYMGGRKDGKFAGTASLTTRDGQEKVIEYYKRELSRQGWNTEELVLGTMHTLTFQKSDARGGTVAVTTQTGSSETSIIIGVSME